MGFCSDNCRKSYHKHGGAYRKLKVEMKRMVEKGLTELRSEVMTLIRVEVEIRLQARAITPPSLLPLPGYISPSAR